MKSKLFSFILIAVASVSLFFALYTYSKASSLGKETGVWKAKYEEALIDMEEANTRIELMKEDLEKALKDSEMHRARAEAALLQLQKKK